MPAERGGGKGGHGAELKEGAGEEEGGEGGETACHAGGSWSRKNSYGTTNLFFLLVFVFRGSANPSESKVPLRARAERASARERGRAQRGCEAVMLRASEHVPHDCAEHRARGPGEPGRHQASYRAPREGHPAMPRMWTHGAACRSRAVRG